MNFAVIGAILFASSPGFASETDDRIESAVKNTYVFKTHLKEDSIKVKSADGVVQLTGTVASDANKSLAAETVGNLPGVKRVDNQLAINADSPAEYSDGWLTLKVKSALMFHRNVSAIDTQVTTDNGTVTLRGEAANRAQKELTTEYAQDITGVKAVKNEMTLAKAPAKTPAKAKQDMAEKIDDASITAQIKASLALHRSTSAINTKVQTTDGVVTVSGVAKNAAEKSLVSKLVNDIHGVSKVINDMTITPVVAPAAAAASAAK